MLLCSTQDDCALGLEHFNSICTDGGSTVSASLEQNSFKKIDSGVTSIPAVRRDMSLSGSSIISSICACLSLYRERLLMFRLLFSQVPWKSHLS